MLNSIIACITRMPYYILLLLSLLLRYLFLRNVIEIYMISLKLEAVLLMKNIYKCYNSRQILC